MVDIVFNSNPLLYRSHKQEVITEYRISSGRQTYYCRRRYNHQESKRWDPINPTPTPICVVAIHNQDLGNRCLCHMWWLFYIFNTMI